MNTIKLLPPRSLIHIHGGGQLIEMVLVAVDLHIEYNQTLKPQSKIHTHGPGQLIEMVLRNCS